MPTTLVPRLRQAIAGNIEALDDVREYILKRISENELASIQSLIEQAISSKDAKEKANGFYLKALIEMRKLDQTKPDYTEVNRLLDKAREFDSMQALHVLAEHYRSGKGQPQSKIEAAILIRAIQEIAKKQKISNSGHLGYLLGLDESNDQFTSYICTLSNICKDINEEFLKIKATKNFTDETCEILYHLFMPSRKTENIIASRMTRNIFNKDGQFAITNFFIKNKPKQFLALINQDSYLSDEEKRLFVNKVFAKHPNLFAQTNDKAELKLLESVADKILCKQVQEAVKNNDFESADKYLALIPKVAKEAYGNACYDIGVEIHQKYFNLNPSLAIKLASPYFENGMRYGRSEQGLGSAEECKVYFRNALGSSIEEDVPDLSTDDLMEKYKAYITENPIEQNLENIKQTIKLIPKRIDDIIRKIDQVKSFSLFKPAKYGEINKSKKTLEKYLDEDSDLLGNIQTLDYIHLEQLISKYSKIIEDVKNIYPAGKNHEIVDTYLDPYLDYLKDFANKPDTLSAMDRTPKPSMR